MKFESLVGSLEEIIVENVKIFNDPRGTLGILDYELTPFKPQHAFYLNEVPQMTNRGGHAHKKAEQYLICLNGNIEVTIKDDVKEKKFSLSKNQAIYLPPLFWSEQLYVTGAETALVLSSKKYDRKDYLRNWEEYLSYFKYYHRVLSRRNRTKEKEK